MTGLVSKLFLNEQHDKLSSIKNHLNCLLNTRQGSVEHIPEYGLPDVQTLYQSLPDAKVRFIREVTRLIEEYEPRLSRVNVSQMDKNELDCVLHLVINACVNQSQPICLDTYFLTSGQATIQ